jgi:hypothetical protein
MLLIPLHPSSQKFVSTQHTLSGSSVTSLHVITKLVSERNLREMFSDVSTLVSLKGCHGKTSYPGHED